MQYKNVTLAILLLILCSCTNINRIKDLTLPANKGSIFSRFLAKEYKNLAEEVFQDGNWSSFKYFKNKAHQASKAIEVAPETISNWQVDETAMANLLWASSRLETIMLDQVKESYPLELAHAQMLFDCWLARTSSGAVKEKIEQCRMDFVLEMSALENKLMPFPGNEVPIISTKEQLYQPRNRRVEIYLED